jgi:hypothetical protein
LKCVKLRQVQAEHQPKNKRSKRSLGLN